MKTQWQAWLSKFDARPPRERLLLAVGALALTFFVLNSLLISSPFMRGQALALVADQREADRADLARQLQAQQAELANVAANRAQTLKNLQSQVVELDGKLHAFDRDLVRPQGAPALLERLMGRRKGLQMLGLRTLTPQPVLDRPEKSNDPGLNIYRHGVEIRLAGNYLDLLGYLTDLEAAPERLLWESASLAVETYPRSVLTLRVYTLSLDKAWLVL